MTAGIGQDRRLEEIISTSQGVFVAPFDGGWVAYDVIAEMTHVLGPLGVIATIDEPTLVSELVEELVANSPEMDRADAIETITTAVDELVNLQLLNRDEPFEALAPWAGSPRPADETLSWARGRTHQVADVAITFRSNEPSLLPKIDACFQPNPAVLVSAEGDRGLRREVFIDAEVMSNGGIRLDARDRWDFTNEQGFFQQILDFTNEYAARANSYATLHAGAVRTPDGRLLVLPGQIDSGKSTLTAALVAAGCDYVSDETVGLLADSLAVTSYLKPIALSDESREVLGLNGQSNGTTLVSELRDDVVLLEGAIGTPAEIVLPRFAPGAELRIERLSPLAALKELLANTHNLGRCGSVGLEAVAKAVETIPVFKLVHADAVSTADVLMVGGT